MELEWYSECCTAPPLYNVHHEDGLDSMGICMSCREHASFDELTEKGE